LSPPVNTPCAPCARRVEEYRKWRKAGELSGDHAYPVQTSGQGASDLPLLALGVGGTIFFFGLLVLLFGVGGGKSGQP
jgi:hypothetical protein